MTYIKAKKNINSYINYFSLHLDQQIAKEYLPVVFLY